MTGIGLKTCDGARRQGRFDALDGLRGIAAIAVVAYHTGIHLHFDPKWTVHGDIAVDFFFCLSGFVLAHAHLAELRTGELSPWRFMMKRLVRLAPVLLIGSIIAAALLPWRDPPLNLSADALTATAASSLVTLPLPADSPVWINGVFWSLFAEIIANIQFAFQAAWLRRVAIVPVILCAAPILVYYVVTRHTLNFRFNQWRLFLPSYVRATTSFFIGVLVRSLSKRYPASFRTPFWALAIAVAFPMLVPGGSPLFRLTLSLLYILAINPVIIWAGLVCRPQSHKAAALLGKISFPLYAIHLPIVTAVCLIVHPETPATKVAVLIGLIAASFAGAFLVATYLERPAARWLKAKLPF